MIIKIFNSKIFKFIFHSIEVIMFCFLSLYVVFIVCQRLNGNSSIFNHKIFSVVTGSMVPVYSVNDVILVEDVSIESLRVGDDIAYIGNRGGFDGKIVVHRIVEIEEKSEGGYVIFTQGVNNKMTDPSINSEQIIGKVVRKIYTISLINHIVKNNYCFFFLLFVPFFLIISIEIITTSLELKSEKYCQIDSSNIEILDDNVDNECLSDKEGDDDVEFL